IAGHIDHRHFERTCGPGSIPGLRLSEGRFPINRNSPSRGRDPRLGLRRRLNSPSSPSVQNRCAPLAPRSAVNRSPVSARVGQLPRVYERGCRWIHSSGCPRYVARALSRLEEGAAPRLRLSDGTRSSCIIVRHGKVVKSGGESWVQSASSVSASPTPLFHRHRLTANSLPTTSDQTRQPAEFKHITKRRKRN